MNRWILMILALMVLIGVTVMGVSKKPDKNKKRVKDEENLWGENKSGIIDPKSGLPRFIQKIVMPR
jgi:hypothetical protein